MRPEVSGAFVSRCRVPRCAGIAVALLCLTGCAAFEMDSPPERTVVAPPDRNTAAAMSVVEILGELRRLCETMPAQQAEMVAAAQREYELAPSVTHQLRYASMLALPGIAPADLPRAQRLLRELTAKPEALMPAEHALATVELGQVDHQLLVSAENERLQNTVERSDREHTALLNKRLQAELDENGRLRKQLDEAQEKLDAIANIERSLSEKRTTPERKKP